VAVRAARVHIIPVREEQIAVYQEMIDRHRTEKPDIWAARDVTLAQQPALAPVVVGIWDSGVDAPVFGT